MFMHIIAFELVRTGVSVLLLRRVEFPVKVRVRNRVMVRIKVRVRVR
jgi:hypothetical protein